ncbi:MAG: phosphatase PAP2 family protein [Caulobacteraceae bacterium]|nr:phosphatase PAP2 family protein [Caulobacter sp.]
MKTAVAAAAVVLAAGVSHAQQFEATPRPPGEVSRDYLRGDEVNYRDVMGPPPKQGSLLDRVDVEQVESFQKTVSPERYAEALADAEYLWPRFSPALGVTIDRAHLPKTIQLLYGAARDAALVSSAGKTGWGRIRPYQRLQLQRVCGFETAPRPQDNDPGDRTSYPSGHTTEGWTTGLVLAQIAPARKAALLDKSREYGLSRVICAAHWPTDVEAGRAAATAVFERLMATPAFRRDLECARAEYQRLAGVVDDTPAVCVAEPAARSGRRARG